MCGWSVERNKKDPIILKKKIVKQRSNSEGKIVPKVKLCMCSNWIARDIQGSRLSDTCEIKAITGTVKFHSIEVSDFLSDAILVLFTFPRHLTTKQLAY